MTNHGPVAARQSPGIARNAWSTSPGVLDDPAGQGIAVARPIRDEIRRRVEQLIEELQPSSRI
jgi:arsenate reductase (thioredoxin)